MNTNREYLAYLQVCNAVNADLLKNIDRLGKKLDESELNMKDICTKYNKIIGDLDFVVDFARYLIRVGINELWWNSLDKVFDGVFHILADKRYYKDIIKNISILGNYNIIQYDKDIYGSKIRLDRDIFKVTLTDNGANLKSNNITYENVGILEYDLETRVTRLLEYSKSDGYYEKFKEYEDDKLKIIFK